MSYCTICLYLSGNVKQVMLYNLYCHVITFVLFLHWKALDISTLVSINVKHSCEFLLSLSMFYCNSQIVHPLVVTTHPQEANQLAVGLTDGLVKVIEPSETERKWGLPVPVNNRTENGKTAAPSTANNSEQLQRWTLTSLLLCNL